MPKTFAFCLKKMFKPELKSSKFNMEIDPGGREVVMRRKRLGSFKRAQVLLCILIFSNLCSLENAKCIYDEIEQCNSTSCKCIPCKFCSPGEGLFPQCGSSATKKDVIGCVPCESGITFSAENSTESCQACQLCEEGRKVLRKCTATQNAECSEECMDGYKLDPFSHMCEKIRPNIRKPTTKTFEQPTNHSIKSTSLTTVRAYSDSEGKDELKTTKNTNTDATPLQINKNNKSQIKPALYIIFAVIFTAFAVVSLVVFCKRRKRQFIGYFCCRKSSADQQSQNQDPESIPMCELHVTCDNFCNGILLKNIKQGLARKISVKISKPNLKGWKDIGWELQIPEETLDDIETNVCFGAAPKLPGAQLLEFLCASKPNLTLTRFIEVLQTIKRNDVIQDILEEYQISSSV